MINRSQCVGPLDHTMTSFFCSWQSPIYFLYSGSCLYRIKKNLFWFTFSIFKLLRFYMGPQNVPQDYYKIIPFPVRSANWWHFEFHSVNRATSVPHTPTNPHPLVWHFTCVTQYSVQYVTFVTAKNWTNSNILVCL